MKGKLFVTALLVVLVIGIAPAYAAYQPGSGPVNAANAMNVVFKKGSFESREVHERIRDHARENKDKLHDIRERFKDAHQRHREELKDLSKDLKECMKNDRCAEDHFPYDKYQDVLKEYIQNLQHLVRYLNEINPNERGTGEAIKALEDAIQKIESLPKEPTKDQFRELHRVLQDVHHLIQRIKEALHESKRAHREAAHERAAMRLQEVMEKLKAHGVTDEEIQACRAHMPHEGEGQRTPEEKKAMLEEVIHCLKGLVGQGQ